MSLRKRDPWMILLCATGTGSTSHIVSFLIAQRRWNYTKTLDDGL